MVPVVPPPAKPLQTVVCAGLDPVPLDPLKPDFWSKNPRKIQILHVGNSPLFTIWGLLALSKKPRFLLFFGVFLKFKRPSVHPHVHPCK